MIVPLIIGQVGIVLPVWFRLVRLRVIRFATFGE